MIHAAVQGEIYEALAELASEENAASLVAEIEQEWESRESATGV